MRKFLRPFIVCFMSMMLTACAVGPDFHPPPPPNTSSYVKSPLPKKTTRVSEAGQVGEAQYLEMGRDIPAAWWQLFHSPQLNQLIQAGLANSPNLAAAEATLHETQQRLRATIGNLLYPSVDLAALARRSRSAAMGSSASTSSSSGSGGNFVPGVFSIYYTAVSASYQLDVFGGLRRQVEAARTQVDYERFQWVAAYLSLTSNIVTTAITSAALQAEITTTEELIREESQLVSIMQKQWKLGGISQEDLITQETKLAQTQALLPPFRVQLAQSQDALAVLVGALPSQSHLPQIDLNRLHLPTHLPISLPSRFVRQRPDVQAAAATLHQASANIGVATANLLPQFAISANYGYLSTSIGTLFTPSNVVWSLAGQLLQPIFHGAALVSQRRAAIEAYRAAYSQYRQTVLVAFQNVADSLQALTIDADEFKAEREAELSAEKTYHITRQRFLLGGQDFLNVLTAEQFYQQAKINRIKAQAERYNDTAALFQSLGGGWWNIKSSPKTQAVWNG